MQPAKKCGSAQLAIPDYWYRWQPKEKPREFYNATIFWVPVDVTDQMARTYDDDDED